MTEHNEAKKNEIAKTVIMPGDPLRAKYIAETYLKDIKLVNEVRNMYAYTGFYKDVKITVMASGMGMPSVGIYSYELFKDYDVDTIIRVGSCGSYVKEVNIFDVILATKTYSDSAYAYVQNGSRYNNIESSVAVNNIIKEKANELNIKINECNVYCSDVMYKDIKDDSFAINNNCPVVEMESFALFHNAKIFNKKASCILTVSDSFVTLEKINSEERQHSFHKMMELALESAIMVK